MRPPKPILPKEREFLRKLLKEVRTKADFQRVQCLWLRAELGLNSTQIAACVSLSSSTVKIIQARFFKQKEAALIGMGRGGRRHENLSINEEKKLLNRFLEFARRGGVLVVSEIKAVYEKKIGYPVPKSTVYRMLARHGWRKIAPRPRHPKSDPAHQEAFKKTSHNHI